MTNRVISTLMWVLGALDVVNGIAMFFAPGAWFFQLVPGVPETGSFNAHLVQDSGTFFLAVGIIRLLSFAKRALTQRCT